MALYSSSVLFPFSNEGEGVLRLENGGPFVGLGSVPVKLFAKMPPSGLMERFKFDNNDVKLFASVGSIAFTGRMDVEKVKPSLYSINGASTLKLSDLSTPEILIAFDEKGNPLPIHGQAFPALPGQLKVVSHQNDEVRFSREFYGVVKGGGYDDPYHVLKYTPLVTGSPTGLNIIPGLNNVLTTTFGVVAAYRNGVMAMLEVDPYGVTPGDDQIEIYRIESQIVINKEGAWEMPDNWPDNPSYPNGATPPRARSGIVSTRVHEAGYVTKSGYVYTRSFFVMIEKPYWGDNTYKPKKTLVKGDGLNSLGPKEKANAEDALAARSKGTL